MLSAEVGRRHEAVRDRGRFDAARCVELTQDVRHVVVGRRDADHELRRDLAVREASCDQRQHLGLKLDLNRVQAVVFAYEAGVVRPGA
jgi:hypothetical protein